MTLSDWQGALDDFESKLRACEAQLDPGAGAPPEVEPFTPPAVRGPLPPDLTVRAQALLAHAHDLEARITAQRDLVRDEIQRLPRSTPPTPERRSRIDIGA